MPASIFSSVDLPSPLRPTNAVRAPLSTVMDTLSRTAVGPKAMEALCTRINDMEAYLAKVGKEGEEYRNPSGLKHYSWQRFS